MRHFYDVGDLLFDVSADDDLTNVLAADPHYQHCDFLIFLAEEDAFTGTITLLVSFDGTTYSTLQSGGSDVAITAVDAVVVEYMGWSHMALSSDGTEADDANVAVRGVEILQQRRM